MSVERSLSRSLPFLPRYHSVSSTQNSLRLPAMIRSRSQPSQRISYFQGTVNKFLTHSRPSQSPSPQRVYLLCPGKKSKGPLTRLSRSKSHSDLYASHVYTSLECVVSENEHPDIEVDARATSCNDIYHKGPFFPDVSQSESGISVGESEDGSLYGGDDDNASQISYGSSSAFHEITIDSELDRLDSEDGLRSPREPNFWYRFRGPLSPDNDRNSPFPYADSRKRELMSSPYREFERTQSRPNMLQVLIPTPDGSMAKERLTRKDSSGASTPLAQSTPHESPRGFMGPKLSIAGCWDADDPYDGDESHNDSKTAKKIDDSSCYSSVSEDNSSDVSPSKHKSTRKVKLTKKASDLPAKRSNPKLFILRGGQQEESKASEESLENIYIPPLESVIFEDGTGNSISNERDWWAVYNIGAADARREEEKIQKSSPTQENDSKPEIKIVKPVNTGIPLITAGKHGKEKLKRYSQFSPPPRTGIFSPKSSSPSPSDQSDYESQIEDVIEKGKIEVQEKTPLVKLDCKERAEDVLKKATQNLNINGSMGAFGVVRTSSNEEEGNTISAALDNLRNLARADETSTMINDKEDEISNIEKESLPSEVDAINQGAQFMKDELDSDSTTPGYLPCVSTLSFEIKEKKDEDVENKHYLEDTSLDNNSSQVLPHQTVTTESSQYSTITSAADFQPLNLDLSLSDQAPVQLSKQTPLDRNDVDYKDDGSDSPEEADSRHYLLGNSDTKGQTGEAPAIFAAIHLPGEENTQVGEQRIVDVGGSRRGVGTFGLREENVLTSYTPGKGEDNNNSFTSHSSTSVETPLLRADGFILSEPYSTINSKDSREQEFEDLCSAFATALTISDHDETLVDEKESEEDVSTEYKIEEIKQIPLSLALNVTTGTKESTDQQADKSIRTGPSELDETLLSSPIFEDKIAAINEFEILSGNVGIEESKQTGLSSHEALSKSSFDDDQLEADTNMEWRFIDPRLLQGVGKSHEEGRRGDDEEEAMEEGFDSPLVVRIIATAELPRTHTVDKYQQRLNYVQPLKISQDYDSLTHSGLPTNYHSSHQEFTNSDQRHNIMLSSEVPINGIQSYDSSQNNGLLHQTSDDDAPLKMKQTWEIRDGKINPNGSIKYQSEDGDLGGDKGIPRDEKTNAQNKDGASRQCGDEHTFLSGHLTDGPATESRAETANIALSQQVKHIYRKTVEETVTIERSSCTRSSSSSNKNHSESDGNIKECDHCVEFVKNRKETVIHEEDEIFTTAGPVSYVVAPKHDENVSSENASFTVNKPTSSVCDLTHSTHDPIFNQKDPTDTSFALSSPNPDSMIVTDTNQSAPPRPPLPSDASISQFNSESAKLHASTMKWRDTQTIPPTQTQFDPNFDPSNRVTDGRDNSMVIGAEHSVMKHSSTPVTHHRTLDHLQAQLSHISGSGFDVTTTPFFHANVFHDRGEATTNGLKNGSEVIENVNSEQINYCIDRSPSITATNKEKEKSGAEVYDNDYDYITADQSNETSHCPSTSRQHQLLKPGNLKSSSLWTLQEETESLLEGLSPISSPKRRFATVNVAERCEVNRKPANENVCHYSEIENRNENTLLHPSISAFRQRKFGSESSDFDESDGNYSSISTADSYRSSSYGREQTPLSDSDIGVPGDFGVDKLDYSGQTSRSLGQANESISSFNDFLDGLKGEPLTSDWSNKSLASVSNNELNQQTPINFGNSQDNRLTSFKSSVAFCVSATHQAPAQELSLENSGESIIRPSFQSSNNIPISSAPFSFKKPFPVSSKSSRIPPFPVEEDSLSTSSFQDPSDDAHSETSNTHSEASSRLYALDLDLSRMSSCASPTPSDFSDGSFFTCKGTAEIKKGPSVSFEDDYDMLPVPTPRITSSTPKPLKSALKKPVNVEVNQQRIIKDTAHEIWVKQFDKILDDFNNKTNRLGPESEVVVLENQSSTGSTSSQGPNCNRLYKAFTNDESEKKQNNVCPVVEDDNMNTFRFKRFLKKSHTKRSKGRRLVRFLSRLSCVSESVHSPDMSATRKRAKLEDGQAYGTDFMPSPPERVHQPLTTSSYSFQQHHIVGNNTKDSPTSSNHSLDSCPSRTDSAYSSVSESFSGTFNSPRHSSRLSTNSFSPINNNNDHFYLDSVNSSTSDYSSVEMASETSDPFSPPKPQDMLTALSDVFDQLDMCEGEIDTALLDRLRYGHQAVNSNRDS